MSHKRIIADQTGGYPLDLGTVEFMQQGYNSCLQGLASAFGDNVIVSGVVDTGANYSNGWVIIGGELLPFVGGLKNTRIVVEETIEQVTYEDTISKDAEVTRVAKCASVGGVLFSDFVRLDATHLKRSQSKSVLNTKVIEVLDWDMKIEYDKTVSHGFAYPDFRKIRSVSVLIKRNNNGHLVQLLPIVQEYTTPPYLAGGGLVSINDTSIYMHILSDAESSSIVSGMNSMFRNDNSYENLNPSPYVRAYITIQYED